MLTKPNIMRLIAFTLVFISALYYPVRGVVYYESKTPEEFHFRIAAARLNEKDFEIRPRVSGRWQWVDYIFPRGEDADKLLLELVPSEDERAPKLTVVNYPMSRKQAAQTLQRIADPAVRDRTELVIKCYPNGRWRIGRLVIDGQPVSEPKTTDGAAD